MNASAGVIGASCRRSRKVGYAFFSNNRMFHNNRSRVPDLKSFSCDSDSQRAWIKMTEPQLTAVLPEAVMSLEEAQDLELKKHVLKSVS